MAAVIEIANAVVAEMNRNEAFTGKFTAEINLLPEFELKEMKTLRITVVPKSLKVVGQSRDASGREIEIDIGVQQRTVEPERLAELLQLVEDIIAVFDRKRLADYPTALCVKVANDPIYDPEHLRQMRQFTSVITLTFKVL